MNLLRINWFEYTTPIYYLRLLLLLHRLLLSVLLTTRINFRLYYWFLNHNLIPLSTWFTYINSILLLPKLISCSLYFTVIHYLLYHRWLLFNLLFYFFLYFLWHECRFEVIIVSLVYNLSILLLNLPFLLLLQYTLFLHALKPLLLFLNSL
jgi:hypothetical protein